MAEEVKLKGNPVNEQNRYVCRKCGKTKVGKMFFTYHDGSKVELCRDCLTMHINNFDPDTFLWVLEKLDVPYVPTSWNKIRDKEFAKNPNLTGTSVLGKYLSVMKLGRMGKMRWADTERLNAEEQDRLAAMTEEQRAAEEAFQADLKRQYEEGTISEAEYRTYAPSEQQAQDPNIMSGIPAGAPKIDGTRTPAPPPMPFDLANPPGAVQFFNEGNYVDKNDIPDPAADLTQEEKVKLAMKWGRLYSAQELLAMEVDYNNMMDSFDIQDADTENTLKILCKANLKMNQAIDNGDIDTFKKLSATADSLRKSAKFSAATNKNTDTDQIDCVGNLVKYCEEEGGFIERYATDIPQDKVDKTLQDMNEYLYKLVTEDLGFGAQIEGYVKKIQMQEEEEAERSRLDDEDVEHIYDDEILDIPVTDHDVEEFYADEDAQREADAALEADANAFEDYAERVKRAKEIHDGT